MGQGPLAGVTAPTTRIAITGAPPAGESVDLPPEALPRERHLGALPDPGDRGDGHDHDLGGLEPAHQVAVGGVLSGYTEPPGPLGGCRRRRARAGRAATGRKALYIGNLTIGVAGQTSPLKPVSGPEISPVRGHCMKLREKLPGRVPLLRPELPFLMAFYTRIWPSKGPQSPSGSSSRPRSVLDGEKHAPQAPEVDPPCPLPGAQLTPRRPRRRPLAGQHALVQSKTRPFGDLLRQVIRQLVFENRDLMEVRRRGDKSCRVRPFEGQKEGFSTPRRGI
jgi:hypothetical protein